MFEHLSKCKFDLSISLEQDFNAFEKAQFKNTVIVTEFFKEHCIILVLKLFKLYSMFGFDVFGKGKMPSLVTTHGVTAYLVLVIVTYLRQQKHSVMTPLC